MIKLIRKIIDFFDKLEDVIRATLSQFPILYTFIGGFSIVLFWRGVWKVADELFLQMTFIPPWLDGIITVVFSVTVFLATGLFVSFFITDRIILTGLTHEKKLAEKEAKEIETDSQLLHQIMQKLHHIEAQQKELAEKVAHFDGHMHG